ncbi:Vegetative incompatibility protein HET-E-1 [Colletotrichum siamense]|nr:Vegetative incompatibility protein HET-E-1 [Colletotrichum siamense]
MDTVTLSLTVVGLIPVVADAIQRVQAFYADAKNAKTLIQQLMEELEALRGSLVSLQQLLDSPAVKANGIKFDQSSVLVSCSTACKVKLQSLSETLKISIQGDIKGLKTAVNTQVKVMEDSRREQKRREVLDWISDFDHEKRHLEVKHPRVDNTGSWVLENTCFKKWRDVASSANVLWCHGLPGSGKTVLASVIIDHLRLLPTSEASISHFYLKYSDEGSQILPIILASLLKQVLSGLAEIPKVVMQAFESNRNGSRTIGTADAMRMLLDVSTGRRLRYVVLDALDECEQSQRRRLLHAIEELAQCDIIKILVTSRSHLPDIEDFLACHTQIPIQAHDGDLTVYMQRLISDEDQYGIIDEEFANHIMKQMTSRANGTFLPVVLQLETVLRKTTRGHMEDALSSTSDDLAIVFEDTMARIDRLPEDHRLLAKRVLSWFVYAKAGLTSEELGDALSVSESVNMEYASWSTRYRPPSKMMGNCCQGLVILEPVTNRLSFAHYTVQEYLEIHAEKLFPGTKEDISSTCLLYLLYEDFDSGPCSRKEDVHKRVIRYPFVRYAARYWGKHVALTEQHPAVSELLSTFLKQRASTAAACQVMQYDRGFKDQYCDPDECLSVTPLHIASRYGLRETLQKLLKTSHIKDINLRTAKVNSTPVILAASEADPETLGLLLDSGADPTIHNWYGDALHCACEAGESQNARQLVKFGMTFNAYPSRQRPPVMCTLDRDSVDTFRTLVELAGGPLTGNSSFISTSDPDLLPLLVVHAVKSSAYAIVKWLLENKQHYHRVEWLMRPDYYNYSSETEYQFDLNAPSLDRPALHQAILEGDVEMVRLLVSCGASPYAKDLNGKTALSYAADSGIGAFANILRPNLHNIDSDGNQTSAKESRIRLRRFC